MLKLLLRLTQVLVLVALAVVPALPAASAPPAAAPSAPPEPSALLQALTAEAGGDLRVTYHRGTGQVNFIGGATATAGPIQRAPAAAASLSAAGSAQQFLAAYGGLFGLTDPATELAVQRERTLDDGRSYVRFQQQHQGVPVLGGELIVSLDAARNVLSAGGEILPALSLAVAPALDAAAARQIALEATARYRDLDAATLQATAPELWVYNPALLRSEKRGASRLVWRMDVSPIELSDVRELVLVDAASGRIALHFNQIHTALNRLTYTGNNTTTLPGTLVCNQAQANCGEAHATGAHLHSEQTYNYYFNVHGRDSLDNAGLTIVSTVHHRVNYFNAFWNGTQAVYGDAADFPLADDVVAHELTHAVTQYESNLFYYYQSGAINESLSDLWGEAVDQTNGTGRDTAGDRWYMGEDTTVAGDGALRNMADPTEFGDPDRIGSPLFYLGDGDYPNHDNGGVHFNSGVNNKAIFLMVDGGTFNGQTVSPLGMTKTAKLYYEVQTNLLWSGSDYLDLYNALNQACANLLGTVTTAADCQEVLDATHAVEMNEEPSAGYNTDAALCAPGLTPVSLFFDGFEAPNPAWTTGALVGSNRWEYFTGYATSGTRSLLGNDFPGSTSDSVAALNPGVASLPAGAYLHFAQSYGFEQDISGYYDGGVLEYSTNGGSSWTDAGALMEVNGYDAAIAASFGNPLAGRSAFVGDSHGYISTRLNLASLAGQAVRFRWRLGTDSIFSDFGWWIDDVRLYTCADTLVFVPFLMR